MIRLDSHQHFWRYNSIHHTWMTEQMNILRHDYLPQDLKPLLQAAGIDGSVAVQARQVLEETEWLLALSDRDDFIKAVIGWVDLQSPKVQEQLEKFALHSKFRGVRHVVHDEPDSQFMYRPEFRHGISLLDDFNLTYDLLLYPKHLPAAIDLVRSFPHQLFALDHIGKPNIRGGKDISWEKHIETLATFPNVFCKLSGLVTEAKWKQWQEKDFYPYLDVILKAFDVNRVMIGSDWPVCILSGDYISTISIVRNYVQQFSAPVIEAILGGNCAKFYGIEQTGYKHE